MNWPFKVLRAKFVTLGHWKRGACNQLYHDDVIKYFPRCWPFVRGIHRSPVNSPHKGQRRGALMFSLFCAWINGRVSNREAGDLRRHCTHHNVIEMMRTVLFCCRFVAVLLSVLILWIDVIYSPIFSNLVLRGDIFGGSVINWTEVVWFYSILNQIWFGQLFTYNYDEGHWCTLNI